MADSLSPPRFRRNTWAALLRARAGRLMTTSTVLSLARIAGAGAGFLTQVLLARTLHASALGVFFSVTSLAAVVGLVATYGYPLIAPRFVSRYREQGKLGLIAAFVARARRDATLYAAIATGAAVGLGLLWPSLSVEERLATIAAALSIPALAALRFNGALATALRRFHLAYLPDTCIRPFLLLAGVLLMLAAGITLTAPNVALLLTVIVVGLALTQFFLLRKDLPRVESTVQPEAPVRYVKIWRREARPLILVALLTYFFADVNILIITPLLQSADTAIVGLCLKLALLVGFAVQVTQQLVVPDLADAHARKEHGAIRGILLKALGFPVAVTIAALVFVALWGETLLSLFGPEFTGAKVPLLILLGCQLVRAAFGPNVPLLTVIGAQRHNALVCMAALVVLALANVILVPVYGVLGAAFAVTIATVFWLGACSIVLARLSGLRTDAVHLLGPHRTAPKAHA